MSSDNPISDAAEGATKGVLEWSTEKITDLIRKLKDKFVQNHILNRYFGILIEELTSGDDLEKKIIEVLKNIEKHTLFVLGTSTVAEVFRRCITIVDSHSPSIFVIAGFGSAAKIVQDSITPLENVMNNNYQLERFSGGDREILFFKRKLNKL